MTTITEVEEKVDQCRRNIILRHNLFAHFLLGEDALQAVRHPLVPTASTNGIRIWYNPAFFAPMRLGEIDWVIMHEVAHMFLGHPRRFRGIRPGYCRAFDDRFKETLLKRGMPNEEYRKFRDKALSDLFNEAADHVVNLMLADYFGEHKEFLTSKFGVSFTDPSPPGTPYMDSRFSQRMLEDVIDILFQEWELPPEEPQSGDKQQDDSQSQQQADSQAFAKSGAKDSESGEPGDQNSDAEGNDLGDSDNKPGDSKGKPSPKKADPKDPDSIDPSQAGNSIGHVVDLPTDAELEKLEEKEGERQPYKWENQLLDVFRTCQAQGFMCAGLQRLVNGSVTARVRWKDKLIRFARSLTTQDYDWMTRDRRFAHSGVILPGLSDRKRLRIVFVVDTSGSISTKTLTRFLEEIRKALKEVKWTEVTVLYIDTAVTVQVFKRGQVLDFKPTGGGGTDFRPAFRWVQKNYRGRPDCLIYFTDGYGTFPEKNPGYPTLWLASVSTVKYPAWSKVIHLSLCES